MKSSWWMILLGFMLLLAGLANTVYAIHQIPSPFDVVDESTAEVSSNSTVQQTIPTIPINGGTSNSLSQPAHVDKGSEQPTGLIPDRLVIASIGLDTPVVPAKVKKVEFEGKTFYQWLAPNKPAVGWHDSSALLGLPGNTVLNGHHNVYGKVFKDLVKVHEGDLIEVFSGDQVFKYRVALAMLLPERFKSLTIRFENARWILPSDDERLTLITCWPADSNTHRVVIVALPEK